MIDFLAQTKFAIIIENFDILLKQRDGPQIAKKIYKKLEVFKRHLMFPFSFIFVSNSACEIAAPKIIIPYPGDKILEAFVKKETKNEFEAVKDIISQYKPPEFLEEVRDAFCREIVSIFNIATRQFDMIRSLAKKLVFFRLEPMLNKITSFDSKKRMVAGYFPLCYKKALQLFLGDLRLSFKPFFELKPMIEEIKLDDNVNKRMIQYEIEQEVTLQ